MSKPKRIFVYRCQCRDFSTDYEDGTPYLIALDLRGRGKGPSPEAIRPECQNEPGCSGPVEFVGVYVPEGSSPPHKAKSGKRKPAT